MSIFRRILGILMIVAGIVGLIIAGAVAFYGRAAVDGVAAGMNTSIGLLGDTVGTTIDSLESIKLTIAEATTTMDTVSTTVGNLSTTLFETEPLLAQVSSLTTQTVPTSLEAVQQAIPNLAGIAGAVDVTLTRLDSFKVQQSILGVPINFDLGIDYAPTVPFNEAVLQIGDSFVGLPEQLRSLQVSLDDAVKNVAVIGNNISDLSTNLDAVGGTMTQFGPLLDQYITVLKQTSDSLTQINQQFQANLNTIKWVVTGLGLWFALYQIVPLYVGWRMLTDDNDDDDDEDEKKKDDDKGDEDLIMAAGVAAVSTTDDMGGS